MRVKSVPQHLSQAVASSTGLPESKVAEVLKVAFNYIGSGRQTTTIQGFGSFFPKVFPPRKVVSPKTKVVQELPERTLLRFRLARSK